MIGPLGIMFLTGGASILIPALMGDDRVTRNPEIDCSGFTMTGTYSGSCLEEPIQSSCWDDDEYD